MTRLPVFLSLCLWFPLMSCDQHLLLDTTKESMLDWTRYPYGPQSPTPGWVEESFTNFEKGINWRSYVVCDVGYPNVNNWLWTPFITRHDAEMMYIEVKFSLRNCDLFPGTALQCKETFSLLYYEFDAATREPPPWEPESYKQIDVIAADEGRFTNNNEVIINTETRSIEVTKKGVYFAFRDQGACLSLLAVKVYYLKCPEINQNFAQFPETPTGERLTSIQRVSGTCVRNSAVAPGGDEPYNLCQADGTWNFVSGLCQCASGYEASPGGINRTCSPCPVGKYKDATGADLCNICPPQSQSLQTGSSQCECNKGFYRSHEDSPQKACTRPPSAPQHLRYRLLDTSTVVLSWEPPRDDGARSDTTYAITCTDCPSRLTYEPAQNDIDQNEVRISGLYVGTTYTFQVRAENGVSSAAAATDSYNEIRVMSEALAGGGDSHQTNHGSMVSGVRVAEARPTQMRLTWNPPPADPLQEIEVYEVKYFIRGFVSNSSVVITKRDSAEIKGLRPQTQYGFQVRAQTLRGWSDFSPIVYKETPSTTVFLGEVEDSSSSVEWTVGVVCIVILLLLLILALAMLFKRRIVNSGEKKEILDSGCSLNYSGMDKSNFMHSETQPIVHTHTNALGTTLYNPFPPQKTYVDPHTYEDPNVAIKHFAKEIDAKYITIEAIIGGGEFGEVCRGRLGVPDRNDMLVAIKTLKHGSSDKEKIDFLTEASIMGQFEHPNVIFLQGVVTKANPIMILTEYMENGSLDTFLRANDGKFQVMQLVGMMRGIAYGMQYLAEMNYVHRDLAARNVLVNSQLVCKIADFGLSREILEGNADGAYTTRGGKIPVRWTAPEAIAFRKFTSSSDVWSFGIVMWEVMSYGERPYWTWSNQEVIKHIEKGYRLPAPMDCPEAIHQLMLDAWQKERAHRPSFMAIVKTLDKLICCPETLKKIATSPSHINPFSNDAPDYSAFGSVPEWLASIKMSRYAGAFAQAGIVTLDQVAKVSLLQLTELSVTLVGHQKKIMNSIQAMRAQLSVNMSEGFLV